MEFETWCHWMSLPMVFWLSRPNSLQMMSWMFWMLANFIPEGFCIGWSKLPLPIPVQYKFCQHPKHRKTSFWEKWICKFLYWNTFWNISIVFHQMFWTLANLIPEGMVYATAILDYFNGRLGTSFVPLTWRVYLLENEYIELYEYIELDYVHTVVSMREE